MTAPRATYHTAAKPLLGLRGQPGRLALAVFRLPLGLYRRGRGWLLGQTFLVFAHVGRRTGNRYETAAMVLTYERATGEATICSAWGPNADWIRNLRIAPAVEVRLGRQSFVPEQRFLTDDEAMAVAFELRRRHPHRLRLLSRVLGCGELRSDTAIREFVRTHPLVSFRPRAAMTTTHNDIGIAASQRCTPTSHAVNLKLTNLAPRDLAGGAYAAHRVPSHGTAMWAQSYAFDFLLYHPGTRRFHRRPIFAT